MVGGEVPTPHALSAEAPIPWLPYAQIDMPAARTFQDIHAWQKAHQFTLAIYTSTAGFPKSEIFGLSFQVRKAAVSTAANIAEGFARGKGDKARYLNVAEASLEECRYYMILAKDLGYGDTAELTEILEDTSRLLSAYVRAIQASRD